MMNDNFFQVFLDQPFKDKAHVQRFIAEFANSAEFDEKTSAVQLIITILLKSNESQVMKKKIAQFTRRLADDDFIEQLLSLENETAIYHIL